MRSFAWSFVSCKEDRKGVFSLIKELQEGICLTVDSTKNLSILRNKIMINLCTALFQHAESTFTNVSVIPQVILSSGRKPCRNNY